MKYLLLSVYFCILATLSFSLSQGNNTFKVGDDVEYFDGVNWVDSKILEVGENGKYLLFVDRDTTRTRWYSADDIQYLFQTENKVIATKVEVTEVVVVPQFHVGDIVKYFDGSKWIESIVIKPGDDYTYQIYTDSSMMSTMWMGEKDLVMVRTEYVEFKDTSERYQKYNYKIGDVVEYFDGENWNVGSIKQIDQNGNYLFHPKADETVQFWYPPADIRKVKKQKTIKSPGEVYEVGDIVSVYNGSKWLDCEIIQIGLDGRYQVFYNEEKTLTKWIDPKDVK